ncbi:hypothetical protein KO116_01563 [Halomonas sp. KO116]|nr:hypothetical protein KO116_01563 [Halomonas sp. KO116]
MPVGITWSMKDAPLNERLGVVQPSLRAVFSVREPKSALEDKRSGACKLIATIEELPVEEVEKLRAEIQH